MNLNIWFTRYISLFAFNSLNNTKTNLNASPTGTPLAAETAEPNASLSSYGQILKSSSIIGGANGINYAVGLVRTKAIAVLLGPSGIGLVGSYMAITGTLATIAGLGIASSGVREVAESYGNGDRQRIAETVATLRRVCWITGTIGWILSALLAWPLSQIMFGNAQHAWAIAILGATILLGTVSGGQGALIQGTRRIGDLARIQIVTSILTTAIALGLYAWLGAQGIVPVLIATAMVQLLLTWLAARRISCDTIALPWRDAYQQALPLVRLGLAFMWSGLLASVCILAIRALIVREFGLDAAGIYQASWAISGMFAGFILGAMGADYYPRLTAVAHDHEQLNRLVNEQIEIGILLALPGMVATIAFAPWIMQLFYSSEFKEGGALLPWFALGIFGQVVSWPMGFVMLAKGASRWFAFTETVGHALRMALSISLLFSLGIVGTAIAIPIMYLIYTVILSIMLLYLTGFRWTASVRAMIANTTIIVAIGFGVNLLSAWHPRLILALSLLATTAWLSLRSLISRVGSDHKIIRVALRVPGARRLVGL